MNISDTIPASLARDIKIAADFAEQPLTLSTWGIPQVEYADGIIRITTDRDDGIVIITMDHSQSVTGEMRLSRTLASPTMIAAAICAIVEAD